jgi:hypothetical protein
MQQRRDVFKKLLAPLAVTVVFVTAIGWYMFAWVPAERQRLTNRYLHDLSSFGEILVARVNNFDHVLDNASAANLSSVDQLEHYLTAQVPNLTVQEEGPAGLKEKADDPPGLLVEPDEGTFYLWFAFKPDNGGHRPGSKAASRRSNRVDRNDGAVITRVSIDKLIQAKQIPEEFSTFFITRANDGDIIYQSPRQSAEANLVSDKNLAPPGATFDANGKAEKAFDIRSIGQSAVKDVSLGGANYKLFVQPLRLSYSSLVKNSQTSHNDDDRLVVAANSEVWLLCGLVQTDNLNARSLVLTDSLTSVLWFTLVLVLALAVHPFAKLALASAATRLHSRDLLWQLAALGSIAAAVTFCCLDLYYYGYELDRRGDNQLREVAALIQKHFQEETGQIWRQLDAYRQKDTWLNAGKSLTGKWNPPKINSTNGTCSPQEACIVNILTNDGDAYPRAYPFLQFAGWTDNEMQQRMKWTVRKVVTPFLKLTDVDIPFYWPALDAIKLNKSVSGVSTLQSPNTGETVTTFWWTLPMLPDEAFATGSLVTQPQSLVGPVLPGDVKFAVIDRDGRVEFHSDPGRSLNENFFRECDDDSELRSKTEMWTSGKAGSQPGDPLDRHTFVTNYRGYRQRMYGAPLTVTPSDGALLDRASQQLFLIVFRPLNVEETMNAQVVSEAVILFLLYAVPPGVVIAVLYWRRRSRPAEWLWPTPAKAGAYVDIAFVNAVCAVALLVLIAFGTSTNGMAAVVVISLAALTFAGWRTARPTQSLFRVTPKPLKDRAYQLAATSLLVVTTVLPAAAFFKVSEDLEQHLMHRRDKVSADQQRRDREERIAHLYADISYSAPQDHDGGPSGRWPARDLDLLMQQAGSDSGWWNDATETVSRPADDRDWPLALLPLLERIRPSYNQRSAQTQALIAEDSSDQSGEQSPVISAAGETPLEPLWRPWRVPAGSDDWRGTVYWWGGSALLIGLLYGIMALMSKRLRLGPFCSASADAPLPDVAAAGHLLLVGPPMSGKTERLQQEQERGVRVFDLRRFTRQVGRRRESNFTSALGNRPMDMPDWQEKLPKDISVPIVLDHFEYRIEEPAWLQQKLEALEQLVYRYKRKVIIVSSVDPLDFVRADGRADLVQRWTTLLGMFELRDFANYRTSLSAPAALLESKLSRLPEEQKQALCTFLNEEGRLSPQLRAIATELVLGLPDGVPVTRETLLSELNKRANPYYRLLWAGCTQQEKLALVQLAEENVLNPKSREAAERLARKLLVVADPLPRVVTETFRRFVVGAMPRATVAGWERDEKLPWADLLLGLLVVLTAFLFFTQQEMAKAWLAYIVAAAGAIPALFGALGSVRSGWGKAPDKAASA